MTEESINTSSCASSLPYVYRENLLDALEHEISSLKYHPSPYKLRLAKIGINEENTGSGVNTQSTERYVTGPNDSYSNEMNRRRYDQKSVDSLADYEEIEMVRVSCI